mmetsp:Transcript_21965/g.35223  ORF Transcript_21965/g.35223 Transcript_21965/m.35223 type:complete len:621 (+) Transcript_21965:87-1949(+)|eukprot:CAMPEP_0179430636 /NCGR_PEP_ID=MMETSP0799-20121207/15726_1 /TAXON_ID=46947 /ORGANISM="Geminigera cryophila, Strain CCMP2564" /LENGTH=620 /DNA_ID=CAMNT_0021207165 /DNA_START=86 /DNA_END=1948 /DNA_ORIENTATION=+
MDLGFQMHGGVPPGPYSDGRTSFNQLPGPSTYGNQTMSPQLSPMMQSGSGVPALYSTDPSRSVQYGNGQGHQGYGQQVMYEQGNGGYQMQHGNGGYLHTQMQEVVGRVPVQKVEWQEIRRQVPVQVPMQQMQMMQMNQIYHQPPPQMEYMEMQHVEMHPVMEYHQPPPTYQLDSEPEPDIPKAEKRKSQRSAPQPAPEPEEPIKFKKDTVKAQRAAKAPAPEVRIEYVEKIVTKEVVVPIEKIVIKEIPVEVPVEKIVERIVTKEVLVDRIIYKEVEVEVERIVKQEVQVMVDKYIKEYVEVPVEKIVIREVVVEVEKIVIQERIVEVPVERVVVQYKEVPVEKEVIVERVIIKEVEVPVEIRVPVPVEKIIEKTVVQEVEVIREVPVPIEKIVERIVTKEVPIERTVYKELSHELYIERERYEELQAELHRMRLLLEEERSRHHNGRERVVTKEVPVDRVVYKEVPVEVERVVYRQAAQQPVSTRMVGLGLALERHNHSRETFIEQIIPGFAAYKSNQFQIGDVAVAVDQQPLEGLELDAIRELTVGPEHTFCTLQMMRGNRYYAVTLQRVTPPTLDESNYDAALRIAPGTSPSNSMNAGSLYGSQHRMSGDGRGSFNG